VLIADDDPLIREGLEIILRKDDAFKVVASVGDGKKAVEACVSGRVDVALIDIRMPVLDGVETIKHITDNSETRTIILTTFDEEDLIRQAVKNGARGYLLKGMSGDEIKSAVTMVHNGSTVFQDKVFNTIQSTMAPSRADLSICTEREVEVIKLIAEGHSNKEIGEHLFLSEGTIKNYISSILSKLQLKQRTQIAVYYLKGEI
jgi:DNA-binding NarL/FixJ family response regulator